MSGVTSVSNETLSEGAGASVNLIGSNDTLYMANGDYVGLLAGTNDTVLLSSGSVQTLNLSSVSSFFLVGSNDVVGAGTDVQMNVNGSNDALFMANGDFVGLLAGNGDTVILTGGLVDTLNNVTNIILNGSNDTVGVGSGGQLNVEGSNDGLYMANGDYVGLMAGTGDAVIMNGGTLNTLNNVTGAFITGSNNIVATGSGNSIDVTGNSNVLNMSSSAYVGIISGTGNIVYMSGGTLATQSNVTATSLNGSNDVISTGASNSLYIAGSNNTITMGTLGSLSLLSGGNDAVTMSGGSLSISSGQSGISVTGSNDAVTAATSDYMNLWGSNNTINMGSGSYVGLLSGNADTVNMSNGSMATLDDVTNIQLNGSNDTVIIGAGASININGTGDVINAAEGSTVTLSAGDSGDTINMYGGTIVLGANLSNITINGTGDQLSGPDASVAGPVTLASTIITGGNFLTGYTTETLPAYTPPVIYYAGDIQDLVGYFEANPNLSQDQIQAAESDSNYDTNVATYLNTANIGAMQPNVLAMLDGYSSLYLALMGVPATALQEEDEIDQDFSRGSSQAQVPSDGMLTMLQNLLPALLDTNATTKQDVSDALECLANAAADPTPDNIIVTDTAAKLLFEMAEQPDNAKTAPLTEPYRVSLPGLTGPYEIAVQPTLPFGDAGSNEMIYIKNEDGGFWGEFWNDLDSYVVPIVDAAAAVTGNFEIILAASALDAVEAGQDFASGQDLQGVFNVVAAVGGALDAIGSAAQQAEEAGGAEVTDATSNAEVALGSYLSDGVSVAEGIDGIVNGAQTGNALAIVTSALGGVSGIAALGGDSSLQQFASVGASLGASAQELGSGNIIAGLASLVEGAQPSGALQSIESGVAALWTSFLASCVNLFDPAISSAVAASGNFSTYAAGTLQVQALSDGTPGFTMLNPNDPSEPGNNIILADMNDLPPSEVDGSPIFAVSGHGTPTEMADYNDNSVPPEVLAQQILSNPDYTPGETVQLYSCNTGDTAQTMAQILPGATSATPNYATELAYFLGAPVIAPNGYVWASSNGSISVGPAVNASDQTVVYTPGAGDVEGTPLTGTNAWQTFYPVDSLVNPTHIVGPV
jgi:hypothetical protein